MVGLIDKKIVFGTSGWRGKLDQDFISVNVQRAAQGVADYYQHRIKRGAILIGFDPRKGNYEFANEIASILAANQVPVKIILEEPTPTPVLSYLANTNDEISGVINLTASHNKYTDNGFKFSPDHGGAANIETTDLISQYANQTTLCKNLSYREAREIGLIQEISLNETITQYVQQYIIPILKQLGAWERVINYVQTNPDFKLVLDPMQGTSVKYLEAIYRQLELHAGRSRDVPAPVVSWFCPP